MNDILDLSKISNTSTVIDVHAPVKDEVESVESTLDVFGDIVDKSMLAIADPIKPAMLCNRRNTIIATIDEDMSEHLPDIISTTNNQQSAMINEEPEMDLTTVDVVPNELKFPLAEVPYELLLSSSDQSDSTVVTDDVTVCSSTESANTSSRSEERGDDLTDVENLDLSAYGEDSLEAMYYSLRKNDLEVDKQQQNKHKDSNENIESKEISPSEEIKISNYKIEITDKCMTNDGNENCSTVNDIEDIHMKKASNPAIIQESSKCILELNEIDKIYDHSSPNILSNEIDITQEIPNNKDNNDETDAIIGRKAKLNHATSTGVIEETTPVEQTNSDAILTTIDMILTDASNLAENVIRSEQVTDIHQYDRVKCEEQKNQNKIPDFKDEDAFNENINTSEDHIADSQCVDNNQSQEMTTIESVSKVLSVSIVENDIRETISNEEIHPKIDDITDPIAIAMHKQRQLLDRMHGSTNDDFDKMEISELPDIRHNMWTSSIISETDSDYNDVDQKPPLLHKDDFNISTAIGHTSATSSTDTSETQTATTIVSAVTLIQAGARGFLTRRRLRRSSGATTNTTLPGGESAVPQDPGSFGNAAITASLDAMVERHELLKMDTAARIIQRFYRRRQRQQSVVIGQLANVGQVLPTMGSASNDATNFMGTKENDHSDRSSSETSAAIVGDSFSAVDCKVQNGNGIDVGDGDDTVDNCVRTRSEENTISVNISPAATAQQQYDVHGSLKIAANDAQNAPTNQLSIAGGVGSSGGNDSGCAVGVLVSDKTMSPIMMTTIPSSRLDSDEAHQQRRLTLQRGDAVQRNSTPEEVQENECKSNSFAITGEPTSCVVVNDEMVTMLGTTSVKKNSMFFM